MIEIGYAIEKALLAREIKWGWYGDFGGMWLIVRQGRWDVLGVFCLFVLFCFFGCHVLKFYFTFFLAFFFFFKRIVFLFVNLSDVCICWVYV